MNLIINNLKIPIEQDSEEEYLRAATDYFRLPEGVCIVKILSKSIDMKNLEQFFYKITLVVSVNDSYENKFKLPIYTAPTRKSFKGVRIDDRPIIVGFGPAGMFAALEFIEAGIKPLIFERGKKIDERTADIQKFIKTRVLNPESNIQFGEGGAGSYSDGKLFSRRNNNTSYVNRVLNTFIKFGAPAEIAYISKPHLGTDVLCKIVRNIRKYILERGGEIFYGSKMTDLLLSDGSAQGIVVNGEQEFLSTNIYIALGHSARETFQMLHARGVAMEQRPISVGVRIEHPAEIINLMRYGKKYHKFPGLEAATYSLNYTDRKIKRGVYTFCMCPGGEVVNASSEQGALVLNGMSYSKRDSPFSNAALAVTCHAADYKSDNPLGGIAFQREIEQRAFLAGGGEWCVPAQNLMSFLGEGPGGIHDTSYQMGVVESDISEIFPGFVIDELAAAFKKWQEEVPLFVSNNALLLGPETRTSSPVRILRNEKYESLNIRNLYPIGEGAGYAGGISSSAADAIRAVEMRIDTHKLNLDSGC